MKLCTIIVLALAVGARSQLQSGAPVAAPAPGPAPAVDLPSQFAAAYNQDIIINADMYTDKPEILSGGLGFTNIIGVSNSTDEAVVRAANGTWRNISCTNGQPPPNRAITSATGEAMYTGGYNCSAFNYDGLPICFSWPFLPSTMTKESMLVTLNDGTQVVPRCIGIAPNYEFNERHCMVLFDKFGNRIPSTEPGSLFVSRVEVVPGASLQLVGPEGPVSAAGLSFDNPTGKGPYDSGNGPVIMVAKLSVLSDLGEGITLPPITAFPNDGVALYGEQEGVLGPDSGRYRLRIFYSGGMTPDGVGAVQPTTFADHFYLLARGSDGKQVRIDEVGKAFPLGGGLGTLAVLGLADTGRGQEAYDDCYQEDYDNYIDIVLEASSPKAAARLTTLEAFQTDEGYSPLYNPGGPGNDPTPGVRYSSAAPPQSVDISLALEDPATVTHCNLEGKIITNAKECAAVVAAIAAASAAPAPAPAPVPATR